MASERSLAVFTGASELQAEGGRNGHGVEEEPPAGPARPAEEPRRSGPASRRLVSLDAFRGLAILGMLLVNNAALDTATPRPLTHAGWNQGVSFADLVFPWFLLIVGVTVPFSAAAHRQKGLSPWSYDLKLLTRTASLLLLGCLLDSSEIRRPMFDLGVLQLIGLAYFVGALLYELPLRRRLLIAAGSLIAHWAAIRFLPIPGVGTGVFTESENVIYHFNRVYLQPVSLRGLISVVPISALVLIGTAIGDLLRGTAHTSPAGGAEPGLSDANLEEARPGRSHLSLIEETVPGRSHRPRMGRSVRDRWRSSKMGEEKRRRSHPARTAGGRAALPRVAAVLGSGLGLMGIGWVWNLDLPFNKSVWTASYVLFAAGWGVLILGFLYLLIDVAGWRAWAYPLVVLGANAIIAYVAPILVKIHILQEWKWRMHDGSLLPLEQALLHFCQLHAGRIRGGWLYTGAYILFWWLVLLRMYRRGIFWRV